MMVRGIRKSQVSRLCAGSTRSKLPKLATMLDRAYMSFTKAHHKQINSTNPLERLNAEIKRRVDVALRDSGACTIVS
jgi:transposase-like protein